MNAAIISSIVSLIPERIARVKSGSAFAVEGSASRYPERLSHLAQFLNWLSPLNAIAKDDQCILGLLHPSGRPVHANEMDDEEDAELKDGGAGEAAVPAVKASFPEEEALV